MLWIVLKPVFSVTDNHVQQYGEVNQLGGVFVNVSCHLKPLFDSIKINKNR